MGVPLAHWQCLTISIRHVVPVAQIPLVIRPLQLDPGLVPVVVPLLVTARATFARGRNVSGRKESLPCRIVLEGTLVAVEAAEVASLDHGLPRVRTGVRPEGFGLAHLGCGL